MSVTLLTFSVSLAFIGFRHVHLVVLTCSVLEDNYVILRLLTQNSSLVVHVLSAVENKDYKY